LAADVVYDPLQRPARISQSARLANTGTGGGFAAQAADPIVTAAIATAKRRPTAHRRALSRHVREPLHIGPGEKVRPISRAAKEFGSLERLQDRLAGTRVQRPEPFRLLLREM
jgi:hypothetical protein